GFFASGVPVFDATTKVDVVGYGSPAQKMGLRHGDQVLRVNGHAVKNSDQVRHQIQAAGPVTVVVRRNGETMRLGPATPTRGSDGNRYLGFVFALQRTGTKHYGVVSAPRAAWGDISYITRATFSAIGDRFTQHNTKGLSTPVGIVNQS